MEKKYELYKQKKSIEEYFATWDDANLENLNDELKNALYKRYVAKCEVFQRDGFKCRNTLCRSPQSPLTLHHVKKKKNGGQDKARNGLTLCAACHRAFHRGQLDLVLANDGELPPNLRGHTFREDMQNKEPFDWKVFRVHTKKLRKSLKSEKYNISWHEVAVLIRFLLRDIGDEFDEEADEDD